ncbi:DUF2179 domain-containing protein [Candidatus Woesearchaeota archaeon]|nr:DUF2179 domain-containing protein [Candidatus Woesearchaeota archaeon]
MDITLFMETGLFNWLIMPILIFIARLLDMSLGTLRVIFISKGQKFWAPLIGFFEVLIWLVVVRQIITSMNNPLWAIAYAGGFAAGTYIGILFSEKINIGEVLFRIITKKDSDKLIQELKESGFGITVSKSADKKDKATIIHTVVHTRDVKKVGKLIIKHNPKAFYTIEDVKKVSAGVFPPKSAATHNIFNPLRRTGK